MNAAAVLLCAAAVTAHGGDGVPDDVLRRARIVVERALEAVDGDVTLRVYRTHEEMRAAVRAVDPRARVHGLGYYHYRSRTIFVFLAPRPDAVLFEGRLPGAMLGALAHEAMHAKGHLTEPDYRRRHPVFIEGDAEYDASWFLFRQDDWPESSAYPWFLESRVGHARHLFTSDLTKVGVDRLTPAQLRTWYAQAYRTAAARHERGVGTTYPRTEESLGWASYLVPSMRSRITSDPKFPAYMVGFPIRRWTVTPLPVGKGQVDLVFGYRSDGEYAKVAFLRRGGVRAMWKRDGRWTLDPVHPAPALPPGVPVELALVDGVVSVNGRAVLFVLEPEGKVGIGVYDGAIDVTPTPSSGSS